MADHTDTIRKAAADAGLTAAQTEAVIEKCGRPIVGGGKTIGNRGCENAALNEIRRVAALGEIKSADTDNLATGAQIDYLRKLGAEPAQLRGLTKPAASKLIDALKAGY